MRLSKEPKTQFLRLLQPLFLIIFVGVDLPFFLYIIWGTLSRNRALLLDATSRMTSFISDSLINLLLLLNGPTPVSFVYFGSFQTQLLEEKL